MFTIPAPDPVAFNLFGIPIYKYGITMALAIFAAMIIANFLFNRINADEDFFKKDTILEYAPLIILAGIAGARLYFCLLNSQFYLTHPIQILDIRQGGLSIHGGIISGIITIILISRKTKIPFKAIIDPLSASVFAGQAIGRWGNFFNSEAFGLPVVGQQWGLFIPPNMRPPVYSDFELFHPTFFYESCLDLAGFGILLFIISHFGKTHKGLTFFGYLILYSIIRFFIEQIRIDSALNVGNIPVAQIVSGILFIAGICGTLHILAKNKSGI